MNVSPIVQELADDWQVTVPGDIDPVVWLSRYDKGSLVPVYPEPGSGVCLVVVMKLTLAKTSMASAQQMTVAMAGTAIAALLPTRESYNTLLAQLVKGYDQHRSAPAVLIPCVAVFFTVPVSIIRAQDPELFD